jgi:hypothetical protein
LNTELKAKKKSCRSAALFKLKKIFILLVGF